jgi:hypothetical protein
VALAERGGVRQRRVDLGHLDVVGAGRVRGTAAATGAASRSGRDRAGAKAS